MIIQTDINSPEPVNLSIHGSITLPRVEGFIFKDMRKGVCVEINGVFYESIKYAEGVIGWTDTTIKKRCLSDKFPNYKIVPFRITYTEKKCTKCGKIKLLKEFSKNRLRKDGLKCWCKKCNKKWHKDNNEHVKEYRRRPEIKDRKNKKRKERRKTDIAFKVNANMRTAINASLRGEKNGAHWECLVDYDLEKLMIHLEKQFTEGMSWENYGKGGWEIDHVIAICHWNITSAECREFKDCWSLDNLQPLWEPCNLQKGDKPMHPKYLIKPDNIK